MTQFEKERIKFLRLDDPFFEVGAFLNTFYEAMTPPRIIMPSNPVTDALHQQVDDLNERIN